MLSLSLLMCRPVYPASNLLPKCRANREDRPSEGPRQTGGGLEASKADEACALASISRLRAALARVPPEPHANPQDAMAGRYQPEWRPSGQMERRGMSAGSK